MNRYAFINLILRFAVAFFDFGTATLILPITQLLNLSTSYSTMWHSFWSFLLYALGLVLLITAIRGVTRYKKDKPEWRNLGRTLILIFISLACVTLAVLFTSNVSRYGLQLNPYFYPLAMGTILSWLIVKVFYHILKKNRRKFKNYAELNNNFISNSWEEDVTSAILDFVLMPVLILLDLFVIASIVEVVLIPNIGQSKLLFIAIASIPIFILYLRKKLAE